MSSKMIIRSCGCSITKLINRNLSTAIAATSIHTKTPMSVYSRHFFQPNSCVLKSRNCSCRFCSKVAGGFPAATEEIARGQPKFEAENDLDDEDDDDDSDVEFDEDDDSDGEVDEDEIWKSTIID